jgi:Leucine-rich repeat (LRR) protein
MGVDWLCLLLLVLLCSDVGGMVSLQHLDMSHNSLHHLAPQLSSLTALTHLEASDNKLHQSTAVPEELVTLTALKVRSSGQRQQQQPRHARHRHTTDLPAPPVSTSGQTAPQ